MRGLDSVPRRNPINAYQLQKSDGEAVRNLIGRVAMIEMVGPVLARALQPFPVPVRTLDAIHLAALEFIRAQKQSVQLCANRLKVTVMDISPIKTQRDYRIE